jgi:hypothetical protein
MRNKALVKVTKDYYDSNDADTFYHSIWGGGYRILKKGGKMVFSDPMQTDDCPRGSWRRSCTVSTSKSWDPSINTEKSPKESAGRIFRSGKGQNN